MLLVIQSEAKDLEICYLVNRLIVEEVFFGDLLRSCFAVFNVFTMKNEKGR